MEFKRQDSAPALGVVKVKDEPVDVALHHGLDGDFQHPEKTFSTGNTTTVKDEDKIVEFSSLRPDSPVLNPKPEHPRKRQRVVMDLVLVPTLAEIQRKKDADDDDLKKLGKLFKPKKKAELAVNDAILMSRLRPIGLVRFAVNLPRAELNQMVSRLFMSSIYGGSMQATFPKIGAKKLADHGMADFMYLSLKYHPYAPQRPGGGGLWFSPEWYGARRDEVRRVFTRDWGLSMWQYMGQYEIKPTVSLTLAEWLGLKDTRYNWAKGICDMEWGNRVCARIQARKDVGPGREPTKEEVMAVLESKKWSTTPEDVVVAFDCGNEKMGVYTMKCIGYDYRFQLELYDRYPNWTPPESKPKKKGKRSKEIKEEVKVKVKAEDGILPPAKASRGKKRKRATETSSEFGGEAGIKDEEVTEIVDAEEEVFIKIRAMGTKSRPNRL